MDLSLLRGVGRPRTITINDSWRLLPLADIHYFCDPPWWQSQMDSNQFSEDRTTNFHERLYKGFWVAGCVKSDFSEHPQVHRLRFTGEDGLETDPSGLHHGHNSGFAAINLAYHLGVSKIILLGYDMHIEGSRTNWHNEPREQFERFAQTLKRDMLPHFSTLVEPLKQAGVEVINATPNSALTCWPYQPLEEALTVPAIGGRS